MAPLKAAIYLAGHGSYIRPRLIDLQYQRILRYRELLRDQVALSISDRHVFIDLRLPKFAMGEIYLQDVPAFERLLQKVKANEFQIVLVDLDEGSQGVESAFVREALESTGARVLNVFTDDGMVFDSALKARFGPLARDEDVTDSSDIVCFFPSLTSEVLSTALHRELEDSHVEESGNLRRVAQRIEWLRTHRPYTGGGRPFIEERLSLEWRKPNEDAR
jgi:hypothetical protein